MVLPAPTQQPRWTTFFRIFIAIPSLLLSTALGGSANIRIPAREAAAATARASAAAHSGSRSSSSAGSPRWHAAGCRRASATPGAYSVGYSAQTLAYLLLVTDRYPNADPTAMLAGVERPAEHPVRLVGDADDLRFSRVTVFFRLPLAIPHLVWLALWSVRRVPRRDRQLVRDALHRHAARGPAAFPLALRALLAARLRVPVPRRESVPGLRRRGGAVPDRPRAAGADAPEPLEDRLPHLPLHPRGHRQQRAQLGPRRRRLPHVVLSRSRPARRRGDCGTSPRTRCGTARSSTRTRS